MHLITIKTMEYIVYSSTPNIFGWLSCDYSLIGGRLRPQRDLFSIIFCHPNHLPNPNGEVTPPHVLHPPHATSPIFLLLRTSTFGWLLCLPFKFRPLKAKSPFPLNFLTCVVSHPPNTPTTRPRALGMGPLEATAPCIVGSTDLPMEIEGKAAGR